MLPDTSQPTGLLSDVPIIARRSSNAMSTSLQLVVSNYPVAILRSMWSVNQPQSPIAFSKFFSRLGWSISTAVIPPSQIISSLPTTRATAVRQSVSGTMAQMVRPQSSIIQSFETQTIVQVMQSSETITAGLVRSPIMPALASLRPTM